MNKFIYYIIATYLFGFSFVFAQSSPSVTAADFYAKCLGPTYLNRSNLASPVATGLYYCEICPEGYTDNGGQITANSPTACRKFSYTNNAYYAPSSYSQSPTTTLSFANQNGICEPRFGENRFNTPDCVSGNYANQCKDVPENSDSTVRCNPTQDQWLLLSYGGKAGLCSSYGENWGWVSGPNLGYCKYCTAPAFADPTTGTCKIAPKISPSAPCLVAPCPSQSGNTNTKPDTIFYDVSLTNNTPVNYYNNTLLIGFKNAFLGNYTFKNKSNTKIFVNSISMDILGQLVDDKKLENIFVSYQVLDKNGNTITRINGDSDIATTSSKPLNSGKQEFKTFPVIELQPQESVTFTFKVDVLQSAKEGQTLKTRMTLYSFPFSTGQPSISTEFVTYTARERYPTTSSGAGNITSSSPKSESQKIVKEEDLNKFKSSETVLSLYSKDTNENNSVSFLQGILKEKQCNDLLITGFFGTKTLDCLKKFQTNNNIPSTGVVGQITKGRIIDLISTKSD